MVKYPRSNRKMFQIQRVDWEEQVYYGFECKWKVLYFRRDGVTLILCLTTSKKKARQRIANQRRVMRNGEFDYFSVLIN